MMRLEVGGLRREMGGVGILLVYVLRGAFGFLSWRWRRAGSDEGASSSGFNYVVGVVDLVVP